jgi:hypothetical protein
MSNGNSLKQFAIGDLSPDQEMMVVDTRSVELKQHGVRPAGGRFSRHTIGRVEISPGALTADPAIPICVLLALRASEC